MLDYLLTANIALSVVQLIATVLLHLRIHSQCCGNEVDVIPTENNNTINYKSLV